MSEWKPMPSTISTQRLELGPWHEDDLRPYAALVAERDLRAAAAPHAGQPSDEVLLETIRRNQASHQENGISLFAVRLRDRFIGYCGLIIGHASIDEPEIGYELFRADHGRGYATEAARAVVDAAAVTGRSRLWATVRAWNTASFRVLEKVGFERSGRIDIDDFGESVWCVREL